MRINGKNKLLVLGMLLMLLASYKFAIHNTLEARSESLRLELRQNQVGNIPKTIAALRQKEVHYDSVLKKMDVGDTSVQNHLLRVINQKAKMHTVKVMDFNRPHIGTDGENEIYTYSFNIEGAYTDLLKVVHSIERKGNFGEIVHLVFEKKKDYRTDRSSLEATVFVQQVK